MSNMKFDIFIPTGNNLDRRFDYLKDSEMISNVFYLSAEPSEQPDVIYHSDKPLFSGTTIREIISNAVSEYFIILTSDTINFRINTINRICEYANNSDSVLIFSDYSEVKSGTEKAMPLADYQPGSVRDDFNFGKIIVCRTSAAKKSLPETNLGYAGFYDFRLKLSEAGNFTRIPEILYTIGNSDLRATGEKQFDYVNPKNREVQIEMEKVFTHYLKRINAYLKPEFRQIDIYKDQFPVEASVIIPVKNREKTIADAVNSALSQDTNFSFNIIVVDNHSTDGTTEILKNFSSESEKLIHLIPETKNLNIGGCWNYAINSNFCGRFSVQLDSDDLYSDENSLQFIIDKFYEEKTPCVIGSYEMTDFDLNPIPPGIIDHREWTEENGRNNALRINGLGAPRAFYTSLLRQISFPDVSYGEDYAIMLRISREYKISRIYDPVYKCRRWSGNSDSDLPSEIENRYAYYKDRLRTMEIFARQRINIDE